jgi:replicative DNA helicase
MDSLHFQTKEPPANIQAECAVLGAILGNNRAYDHCAGLQPEHFYDDINAEIFRACQRRIEAGRKVDAVTLWPSLQFTGLLNDRGGTAYLAKLISSIVSIDIVAEYAVTIRDCAARRTLIATADALLQDAYGTLDGGDARAVAAAALSSIEVAADLAAGPKRASMAAAVASAVDQAEKAHRGGPTLGLRTGLAVLDEMWGGGLYPGSLDIVGARPSTGKTAFSMQIARAVAADLVLANRKGCVLISSLEMPERDLGTINLSSISGVSADNIRRGIYDSSAAARIVVAQQTLLPMPIEIIDRPRMALGEAIGEARSLKRSKQCCLWVIDHRNLLGRDPDWSKASKLDWYQEVSQRLKATAKTLSLSILLLVQIGRGADGRDDPRPRLSDLEYAGEQDADNVVLLFRPEMHTGSAPERKATETAEAHSNRLTLWQDQRRAKAGVAEVIFAKRRFGAPGVCRLRFDGPTLTFSEPEQNDLWSA